MAQETVFINFEVDYSELTNAQKELSKTSKVDTKGFEAIQAAIDTTATDSKGLIKTFKDVAGASVKMGKSVEAAFGSGVQDALDEAGVSVEEFGAALKKANAPAITLKKELAGLKEALARAKAEGKDTGKEFEALRARAGKLADSIADANAEIKNAGSDTRGIDNVIGSISALAGGYSAAQGAIALFGEESEDLQKALLKVNAAMALATGVQQFYNATLKEGSLRKLADVIATRAQSAAASIRNFVMTGSVAVAEKSIASTVFSADALKNYSSAVSGATGTQKLYESAVKSTTAATVVNTTATTAGTASARALRIALLATGIGLIVVLILAAASAMGVFSSKTDEAVDRTKELSEGIKELNNQLDETVSSIKRNGDLQIEYLKQRGASEKQVFQRSQDFLKDENKAILNNALQKVRLLGVQDLISKKSDADALIAIKEKTAASKSATEKNKALLDEEISALKEVSTAFKQVSDNDAAITLNNEQFKTKTIEDANRKLEALNIKKKEARDKALKDAAAADKKAASDYFARVLKGFDDEENALRIHFENEQDIIERDRAAKQAIADRWEALRQEQIASMAKSGADAAAKAIADDDALTAKRIKNLQTVVSVANQVADLYSQLAALSTEQDNQRIDAQKKQLDAQLKAGAITEKQARIRAAQIEQAEKAARQRAAQREKQAAVFKALIAIPQAFLQGLSQGGYVLAAIYGALAAATAGVIIARPVPKFFRGKKDKYEGPGMVADMGSEIVERGGRMFLYTSPTQTYLNANDKVYTAAETKQIMHNTNINTTVAPQKQAGFDYERLGKSIPKDSVVVNIEKDFISEAVANGLAKNNYFNKRYQFKK